MTFTLKDLVDFCYEHRGTKAFKGFSYNTIASDIIDGQITERLAYVADDQGICGVCIFSRMEEAIHVHQIVAVRMGFPSLILEAKRRFPGMTILGLRHGKLITYKHLWETIQAQVK